MIEEPLAACYRKFTSVTPTMIQDCGFLMRVLFMLNATAMFSTVLKNAGHTGRFFVGDGEAGGWEAREEQDDQILREARYTDWHRVERACAVFSLEVADLLRQGWVEA